ncbi:transposase [Listeria booriae]|uniref:transposase n=1 Tax=Listeria booriae TaxID=1552123 RepID=UPI0037C0A75E
MYRQRKIDVEPVFGHVKALLGFTRFRLRGLPKVATEANLYFMANNMRKLARLTCLYGKNTYPKSSFRFWIGIFLGQRTFCLGLVIFSCALLFFLTHHNIRVRIHRQEVIHNEHQRVNSCRHNNR